MEFINIERYMIEKDGSVTTPGIYSTEAPVMIL
jgi:hypothetical protein